MSDGTHVTSTFVTIRAAYFEPQLSRAFRQLVETSTTLQLKIKSHCAGVTDIATSNTRTKERLTRVQEWSAAWSTARFTDKKVLDASLLRYTDYILSGDVLVDMKGSAGTFTFKFYQIPSRLRSIPEKKWQFTVSGDIELMSFNAYEGLLVALET